MPPASRSSVSNRRRSSAARHPALALQLLLVVRQRGVQFVPALLIVLHVAVLGLAEFHFEVVERALRAFDEVLALADLGGSGVGARGV